MRSPLKLMNQNLCIEVEPFNGGRIAQIVFSKNRILADKIQFPDTYGSVWWPSPQSTWIWPPPKILNSGVYQIQHQSGKTVVLRSPIDEQSSIQLQKQYTLIHSNRLDIKYTATNIGRIPIGLSHWENTRFEKGGNLLFPAKSFTKSINNPYPDDFLYLDSSFKQDHIYNSQIDCIAAEVPITMRGFSQGHRKLFALSSLGWSSYLKNGILLIKVFPIVPEAQIAPEQGNIEVYICDKKSFLELEQQGGFEIIQPDKNTTYTSHWLFSGKLPKDSSSEARYAFIQNLIALEKLNQNA